MKLEVKQIFDAAREGDAFSLDLVDYEAEYLALGYVYFRYNKSRSGSFRWAGVASAGDILLNPLREKLSKYVYQ